jgi:mono/diheme cytochrome c family protein
MLVAFSEVMSTSTRICALAVIWLASLTAMATPAAQTIQSPGTFLGESLIGKDSFEAYCASCHGSTATGDGPVAEALKRTPANLTVLAARNGNRFPREQVRGVLSGEGRTVAAHGTTEMPIWGPLFRVFESDARVKVRIENLVAYIETLQARAPANESGAALFRSYCASCHGADARGAGPIANELRRLPPNLTTFAMRNGGVFPSERLRQIIDGRWISSHGDREMPVWGDAFKRTRDGLTDEAVKARIEAITNYIAGIQERAAE